MRREETPPPLVGDRLELRVEKAVYRGLGLARHEGRVVFVPRGLPGDLLRARVTSVERGFARAETEEILEPGEGRREAPCGHAARCGGCSYQPLEYPRQLEVKRQILAETLSRAGASAPAGFEVAGSPEEGWRTRASLHFETHGAELRLGLHEEGSHTVVDLERCLQVSPAMMEAARGLRGALRDRPHLWPKLRGLHLAEGNETGLVATVDTRSKAEEAPSFLSLRHAAPGLTGLAVLAEQRGRETFVMLHGSPRLGHAVGDLRLTSHARSFFQANRFLVGDLVAHVLALVPPEGSVLDLYAGVGLFALPLQRRGQRARAAEIDAQAVEDARENARRLGLSSFRIDASDVREALRAWPRDEAETVVLDPPRTGAGLDVVEVVAARRPRAVVYVSCDPPTLGRDLAHFARFGYRTDQLRAFDMFPNTFHLEAVALLSAGAPIERASAES